MGLVLPGKAGTYTTVAYGNLLGAGLYGFPTARERRDNEKARISKLWLFSVAAWCNITPNFQATPTLPNSILPVHYAGLTGTTGEGWPNT